ncbi:hypothetical protein ES332_D11G037000v1 [Gossypium tomentosum]|uniref:Uncharacterized protein n=1 Tax=Gossypium tomentosum TaxID=34277 RepID=A0A5D2IIR6_GOSTO|nr:hypothetical protein ES332_D11G037000v1 [Gossypium tomentosum]
MRRSTVHRPLSEAFRTLLPNSDDNGERARRPAARYGEQGCGRGGTEAMTHARGSRLDTCGKARRRLLRR